MIALYIFLLFFSLLCKIIGVSDEILGFRNHLEATQPNSPFMRCPSVALCSFEREFATPPQKPPPVLAAAVEPKDLHRSSAASATENGSGDSSCQNGNKAMNGYHHHHHVSQTKPVMVDVADNGSDSLSSVSTGATSSGSVISGPTSLPAVSDSVR